MIDSDRDKRIEHARYDTRAKKLLDIAADQGIGSAHGALAVPLPHRSPYLYYEEQIRIHMKAHFNVLEIGSGSGLHTGALLSNKVNAVVATDISDYSLAVLRRHYDNDERLQTQVADMESLPFPTATFDMVTSAGSLSYGDNHKVMMEIFRVLKRGGVFISVDSLNHNPVYRLNRRLHYWRGNRSLSTLKRMPNLETIIRYGQQFGCVDVKFFGAISWLAPILTRALGDANFASLSDWVDSRLKVKRSAFKFVMVVHKA